MILKLSIMVLRSLLVMLLLLNVFSSVLSFLVKVRWLKLLLITLSFVSVVLMMLMLLLPRVPLLLCVLVLLLCVCITGGQLWGALPPSSRRALKTWWRKLMR